MKYRVVERRMYEAEYIVEAASEEAARDLDGDIEEENSTDSWGYEIVSVEPA